MDFDDELLDMEAEMQAAMEAELEENVAMLGELEEEAAGGKGPSASPAGPLGESLGLTQELEQLVENMDTQTQGAEPSASGRGKRKSSGLGDGDDDGAWLEEGAGEDEEGGRATTRGSPRGANKRAKPSQPTFLAEPIATLMERVQQKRVAKLLQESEALASAPSALAEEGRPAAPDSDLMTKKYAPKRYHDLLSEEKTNRAVVGWLKLWDQYVFGKKVNKAREEKTNECEATTK